MFEFFFQLLHEFNVICAKDVVSTMEKNWLKVCHTLQENETSSDKFILQKIERNIYHKRPRSHLPITFAMVSML